MQAKPYIGITGFKYEKEVSEAAKLFEQSKITTDPDHLLMLGYLTSTKRLAKRKETGKQSPAVEDLAQLIATSPAGTLPMIHYYTKAKENLADELEQVFSGEKIYDVCQAVQLNVAWPDSKVVQRIKQTFPGMQIVLQMPQQATANQKPREVAQRAQEYEGIVSYVLIDPSGGLGKEFSVTNSLELLVALKETMPQTTMGIAGGLSGENVMARVQEICKEYREPFCIDAQGRLRSKIGEESVLDMTKIGAYLAGGQRGFYGD